MDPFYRTLSRLQFVPRWGVLPTIHKQTVDQHSFRVAWIADYLMKFHINLHPDHMNLTDIFRFKYDVLWTALVHDRHEAVTGDIPSPAKKKHVREDTPFQPDFETEWDEVVMRVVKCADLLEAMIFLREEEELGSRATSDVVKDLEIRFMAAWNNFEWNHDEFGEQPPSSDIADTVRNGLRLSLHPVKEI